MKSDDLCLICGKQREPGLEPMLIKCFRDQGEQAIYLNLCQDCMDDIARAAYKTAAGIQKKDRSPWMRKKTQKNLWKMKQRQGGSP